MAAQQSYWTPENIDIATQGALLFFQVYYETYDEPTRRIEGIPKMYDPAANVIWNGNAIKGLPAIDAFVRAMPLSRHDVQCVDCHPVDDVPKNANNLPTILVTVTGSVIHGPSVLPAPTNGDTVESYPNQVRKFHEVFVLKPAGDDQGLGGVQPKYHIQSSNFRFVG